MADTEREPCPACAEPVAIAARVCPHCHGSVLHDLALGQAVRDGRTRYQIARTLADRSGEPFLELQKRLNEAEPRPVRGRPRSEVRELGEALEPFGVEWREAFGAPDPAPAASRGVPISIRTAVIAGASVLVVVFLIALLVGYRSGGSGPAPAPALADAAGAVPMPGAPETRPEVSAADRAERALRSTVALRCPDGLGAGFFVGPDLILTNAHVATCDRSLQVVLADGRESAGVILRRDTRLDLAVVRAPGLDEPPLPLADAGALRVGDPVTMVGSPVGMEFTVHEGSVSALPRMVLGVAYIQIDAKINPGNSGGPLIDESGRVVGVVSLKRADAEGIGLALPINYAWDDAASLVPPPGGDRTRTAGFADMLEQVAAEERGVRNRLATTGPSLPLLVGGGRDRYGRVVAVVAKMSPWPPPAEDFDVIVRAAGKECRLRAGVTKWERVEEADQPQSMMDARAQEWMRSLGSDRGVYAGEMVLSLQSCGFPRGFNSGVNVELEGADPRAARRSM